LDCATWCDSGLTDETQINFNAGDHAISISMRLADFIRVEQPRIGEFAE
jgi:prolyl-tRNA editing enzyme YbaK/EbsC (Cys-tRNA(Pro) deacylase)